MQIWNASVSFAAGVISGSNKGRSFALRRFLSQIQLSKRQDDQFDRWREGTDSTRWERDYVNGDNGVNLLETAAAMLRTMKFLNGT